MAQKKKKNSIIQDNARKETYMLPSNEKSILTMPTGISNKFENINVESLSAKLSLDSKTKNKTANEIADIRQEQMRVSFPSNNNVKEAESFTNIPKIKLLKEETCSENVMTSSFNQDLGKY